ncbi:MAG: ParB/RepB/Spo0J family partition protein [Christensenellaceae bacterium]
MRKCTTPCSKEIQELSIASIQPSPYQARRTFSSQALQELALSIRQHGLLQPISVRALPGGRYQLIAGERRLRACRLIGQATIRAVVLSVDEHQAALLCMVENLQREGLHFFEEAEGFASLIRVHGLTQEQVAERLGKQQSTIANKLRLLRLPQQVREIVIRCGLSERHARALLRLPNAAMQLQIAQRIASEGLNVRATDTLVERILQELMPLEEADEPASGRVRRAYGDWRLLNNAIKTSVNQMVTAGLPVQYFLRDAGDNMEILVLVPKNAHRAQQPLSVVQGGGATSSV